LRLRAVALALRGPPAISSPAAPFGAHGAPLQPEIILMQVSLYS